jgi:hypothetical protein
MHGRGKSDGPIVLKNLANKGSGAPQPAEWGEGRGPAKGNPIRDVRCRTLRRARLNASWIGCGGHRRDWTNALP